MAFVLTTEAEIDQKTGANVSVAYTQTMKDLAEKRFLAYIGSISRYNWADNIPTNNDVKAYLSDILSSLIAIEAITYDMSGYTSRTEAENMINGLRDGMLRSKGLLRNKETLFYIQKNAT